MRVSRAINYALAHDDGVKPRDLDKADIVLVGSIAAVKTADLSVHGALQYGIRRRITR